MTGPTLALIVVPIVMLVALGAWLALVYYAGEHPEWKAHRLAREAAVREATAATAEDGALAVAGTQPTGSPDGTDAAGVPGKKPIPHAA